MPYPQLSQANLRLVLKSTARMSTAQLTFLRFLGATSIVFFHFGRTASSLAWANTFWNRANASVSFFFVLSGFVLAHVYAAKGIPRARDFYVARIARVVPMYWIALALVVLFGPKQPPAPTAWIWLSALLLQSWWIGYSQILNVPGWSLSVEVFFYLLFPMLLRAMTRMRTTTILGVAAAVWGLNVAAHAILYRWTDPYQYPYLRDFTFYSPFTHLSTFVAGLAGGIVFDRLHQVLRRVAIPLMLATTAAFFATLWLLPDQATHYLHNGLLAPLFVLFLWGLGSDPDFIVSRLFRWSPLEALGEASYGIYILQLPVLFIFHALADRYALTMNAFFWLYYAVLLLASVFALKWIDAPARRAVKRVYGKLLRPV
jgi:peptidoglycan/LPS O-acetylase OafA/YrhL